jgi:hypothetical protein
VSRTGCTLAVLLLALLAALPAGAAAGTHASPVVSVRTVPAVSGLTLTVGNRHYVTDAQGRVLIPRPRGVASSDVRAHIIVGSRRLSARTIVRFARWFTVGSELVAGLDVSRQVRWRFVDAAGTPIPIRHIGRVVVRSSSGEVFVLRGRSLGRPRLLFSRRAMFIRGQVELKDVRYAVQRVTVLGADVVNDGQQQFVPPRTGDVRIVLAFFTLTVRGEDAIFGSSVGTHARLELPNGTVRDLTLVHGRAVVPSLPRGAYTITLTDGVYRMPQPLVLSRSQVAVVPVVTTLDVLVVAGGLLVLALGLVLVGRPYLARRAGARIAARGRASGSRAGES